MRYREYDAWFRAGFDLWSLGLEASGVIGSRMMRLAAGGDAAAREAELMVVEKMTAALELHHQLASDALTLTPLKAMQHGLRHYRRKVAQNRTRLAAPARRKSR